MSDLQKQLPPAPDRSALTELILEAYANREVRITDKSKIHPDPEADTQMSEAAKKIVQDGGYPSVVRAKALLLVGALGTKEDKKWILDLINDPDEALRVAAIGAYSTLDARIRSPQQ